MGFPNRLLSFESKPLWCVYGKQNELCVPDGLWDPMAWFRALSSHDTWGCIYIFQAAWFPHMVLTMVKETIKLVFRLDLQSLVKPEMYNLWSLIDGNCSSVIFARPQTHTPKKPQMSYHQNLWSELFWHTNGEEMQDSASLVASQFVHVVGNHGRIKLLDPLNLSVDSPFSNWFLVPIQDGTNCNVSSKVLIF